MQYKKVIVYKEFLKYNCNHFEDITPCGRFSMDYEDTNYNTRPHDYNKKPDYNPLSKAVFYAGQRLYDIYDLGYVLSVTRGFLISDKLKDILLDYNLSKFVLFEKIKYEFKGELRDDLNFIYFYQDFSDKIDYKNCIFNAYTRKTIRVGNKYITQEVHLVESNVPISSFEDYCHKEDLYIDKGLDITIRRLCVPEGMKYDVFSIMWDPKKELYSKCSNPGSNTIYFSSRLMGRLKKEGIKGIEYDEHVRYDIECPPNALISALPEVPDRKITTPGATEIMQMYKSVLTKQDLSKIKSKLKRKYNKINKYFAENSLEDSIEKYKKEWLSLDIYSGSVKWTDEMKLEQYEEYKEVGNSKDVQERIAKIMDYSENIVKYQDEKKIRKELEKILQKVDRQANESGSKCDAIILQIEGYGNTDVTVWSDTGFSIGRNYFYKDIEDTVNIAYEQSEIIAESIDTFLDKIHYRHLLEELEEVEYIIKLKDKLYYSFYLYLNDLFGKINFDVLSNIKKPCYIFAYDTEDEDEKMELLYIVL